MGFQIVNNGSTPDASASIKGKIKLAGDLGGSADLPTVLIGKSVIANYVPNPSFESSLTGWNDYGGGFTATRDAAFFQSGANSLKIVAASAVDGGKISATTFALGPGTYTFSVYAKLSSNVTNACMILRGTEGLKVQINQTYPGNTNFNRYTATFTLTGSGTYEILLGLGSYGAASPGTVYYDAIQVELGASASTYFDGNTADTATIEYQWTGTANDSASRALTTTALTSTDYLLEGLVNQYFTAARAIAAMSGATISPGAVNAASLGGASLRIYDPSTPASATATGTQGEIRWDANYVYVCTAANTWKRSPLATW